MADKSSRETDALADTTRVRDKRSVNHPTVSLGVSVAFLDSIKKRMGYGAFSRETLAKDVGVGVSSGAFSTKFASCGHFGMIAGRGNDIRITTLGRRITDKIDDADFRAALVEAVQRPTLYRQLIAVFSGSIIPSGLPNILFHKYEISANAKDNAARAFIDSLKFAGLLDAENRLIAAPESAEAHELGENNSDAESSDLFHSNSSQKGSQSDTSSGTGSGMHQQSIRISLTEGKIAFLQVPDRLTPRDIKILRAQINVLAMLVEDESDSDGENDSVEV